MIRTDASDVGVGAVLLNIIDGKEIPIMYLSKTFTEAATRWNTTEQEAYGIWYALTKWAHLILGHHIIVETDHRNLVFMEKSKVKKVMRMNMDLQQFDYTVVHIPGKANHLADYLSRCGHNPVRTVQLEMIITKKQRDLFYAVHNNFVGHFKYDEVMRKLTENGQLEQFGSTTAERAARVKRLLAVCAQCQKSNPEKKTHQQRGTLQQFGVFEEVSMDYMGPYPEDEYGYTYLLVMIDGFSRFVEMVPTRGATAAESIRGVLQLVGRYGLPKAFRTDNGSHFANQHLKGIVDYLRVRHNFSVPYSPEGNGTVERVNGEIMRHLRHMVHGWSDKDRGQVWSNYIPLVQRIINGKRHTSTGEAPATLMYGSAVSLDRGLTQVETLGGRVTDGNVYVQWLDTEMKRLVASSKEYETQARERRSKATREVEYTTFEIGDQVLVRTPTGHRANKLADKWFGPREVIAVQNNTYTVKRIDGRTDLVNVERLRLWNGEVRDKDVVQEVETGIYLADKVVGYNWPRKYRKQLLHRYLGFQVLWQGCEGEAPTNQTYESLKFNPVLGEFLEANPELEDDLEKALLKAREKSDGDAKRKTGNPVGEVVRGKRIKK